MVSRAGLDGFRAAFVVIAIAAALGALAAGIGFPRRTRTTVEEPRGSDTGTGEEDLMPVPLPVEARNR